MKVLNLYACLGGNRLLWEDCEVTAVELDSDLAQMYQERFPDDTVIIGDAHEYLLQNYKNFDFIWSSPPCPSHSKIRTLRKDNVGFLPVYPDMQLYQEILLLQKFFRGKFCVENVIPYYEPLILAQKRGRHLYWCNFILPQILTTRDSPKIRVKDKGLEAQQLKDLSDFHNFDFSLYEGKQRKVKIARNLIDYEVGKTIFDVAMNIHRKTTQNQLSIF